MLYQLSQENFSILKKLIDKPICVVLMQLHKDDVVICKLVNAMHYLHQQTCFVTHSQTSMLINNNMLIKRNCYLMKEMHVSELASVFSSACILWRVLSGCGLPARHDILWHHEMNSC